MINIIEKMIFGELSNVTTLNFEDLYKILESETILDLTNQEREILTTLIFLIQNNSNSTNIAVQAYTIAVVSCIKHSKWDLANYWLDYALVCKENYFQCFFRKSEIERYQDNFLTALSYSQLGLQLCLKSSEAITDIHLAWGYMEKCISLLKLGKYKDSYNQLVHLFEHMSINGIPDIINYSLQDIEQLKLYSFAILKMNEETPSQLIVKNINRIIDQKK